MESELHTSLRQLRDDIPLLAGLLKLDATEQLQAWKSVLDTRLLPRFAPDFPLIAAICGGGSSGKSTLFNSLLNARLAPAGGRAGMNRRLLLSLPAKRLGGKGLLTALKASFQADPHPLAVPEDLLTPGEPLYVVDRRESDSWVLIDTPDFDTGSRGQYVNREVTRRALEASDLLIYIFTNSNYNNRDNTDFVSRMLTGIGIRKCFLIYRVYPSYSDEEVLEHAAVVARGIYSDRADQFLLGVYRADEDNRVASGGRFMKPRPVGAASEDLGTALTRLDAGRLRRELHGSMLADLIQQTGRLLDRAQESTADLSLYRDGLLIARNRSVQRALQHFPMERVLRRFAKIWARTDPTHIKIMRRTGSVIELPLKAFLGAAGWVRGQLSPSEKAPSASKMFEEKLDEDLITAITELHSQVVGPQLSIAAEDPAARQMLDTLRGPKVLDAENGSRDYHPTGQGEYVLTIPVHPATEDAQSRLKAKEFDRILHSVREMRPRIVTISQAIEQEMQSLADQFRRRMGLWEKVSQTFWAFLNVLPATVALSYVLSTGDPVGAAGIKIKLIGLFGAKDLYALFAIPATTGLKRADRKQLEEMLGPIMQTWLTHKLKTVEQLMNETITGDILSACNEVAAQAQGLIDRSRQRLETCLREAKTS
jgi:hypothetical protein